MPTCKNCIHEKVCVIIAFPEAFENAKWEKEPCDHFKDKADYVEVKHGHWIKKYSRREGLNKIYNYYTCSQCEFTWELLDGAQKEFVCCPRCITLMDGTHGRSEQ